VSGSGVTIYNTSSNYPSNTGTYGGITLSGSGTFNLTAPTSGPYAGVVIYQARANTRAISLSGSVVTGLGGTIYAPSALLFISGNASLNGSVVVNTLSLSGNAASTQSTDSADVSVGSTAGELLAGHLLVYVNDPNGLFTTDQLARIQDAVTAAEAVVEPYGVSVAETTDSSLANVVIDTGSNSAVGGLADNILGCWNPATSEITMIQGWNWYAGSDPAQIGSNQYDFQTTFTHQLGHALGLGESTDTTSAMSGTLATGTVIRALTTADLHVPDVETEADAQRAAVTSGLGVVDHVDSLHAQSAMSQALDQVFAALSSARGNGASQGVAMSTTPGRSGGLTAGSAWSLTANPLSGGSEGGVARSGATQAQRSVRSETSDTMLLPAGERNSTSERNGNEPSTWRAENTALRMAVLDSNSLIDASGSSLTEKATGRDQAEASAWLETARSLEPLVPSAALIGLVLLAEEKDREKVEKRAR
jgi:hypothetical protein